MSSFTTLDPKLDIVFKLLFGRPENRELLVSLLDAVLSPPSPIRAVQVESELGAEALDDKGVVLDLRVELEGGRQVDVEMQTRPRPAGRERGLYYWARLYGAQIGRGQHYHELCPCIVIQILAFSELETARFHSVFRVYEAHDHTLFSDQLELHLLELPKLGANAMPGDEPSLVSWGKFLQASTDEEREVLAMTDPLLRKAKTALESLSADPQARVLAEMRDMALKSYEFDRAKVARMQQQSFDAGKAEGFDAGKAEGFDAGKAEGLDAGKVQAEIALALRLLAAKFGALPASLEERIRHATEPELLRWIDRVLTAESVEAVFDE